MEFSPDTKKAAGGFVLCLVIVTSVALLGAKAKADGPSKADLQNLEDSKQNQKCIAENRPPAERVQAAVQNAQPVSPEDIEGYNRFISCKAWNVAESAELAKNGWRVQWSTMTLVPLEISTPTISENSPKLKQADLDKLAHAVAVAETSGCTDGTAINRRNCHGIMAWDKNGKRYPRTFASHAESYAAFKKLWAKPSMPYKGQVPDLRLAKIYSGNDSPDTWLCNVHRSYFDIQIPDCHEYLRKTFADQYAAHFGGTI